MSCSMGRSLMSHSLEFWVQVLHLQEVLTLGEVSKKM